MTKRSEGSNGAVAHFSVLETTRGWNLHQIPSRQSSFVLQAPTLNVPFISVFSVCRVLSCFHNTSVKQSACTLCVGGKQSSQEISALLMSKTKEFKSCNQGLIWDLNPFFWFCLSFSEMFPCSQTDTRTRSHTQKHTHKHCSYATWSSSALFQLSVVMMWGWESLLLFRFPPWLYFNRLKDTLSLTKQWNTMYDV